MTASTFDRVMRGLDVLRRHRVEWNAVTTGIAANGDSGRDVDVFCRDELGWPVVERVTAELLPLARSGWGPRGGQPLYRQHWHAGHLPGQ